MTKSLAALALLLGAQDPTEAKIHALVAGFADDAIEKREEALREVVALGEPAIPLLKKLEVQFTDAEIRARLKTAIRQIEEGIARARVYRPARLVTLSVRDVALKDVVRDACAQAGVEHEVNAAVAGRGVTLEASGEPLLKVLDRICAGLGNVSYELAEGKVRFVNEKFAPHPAAYVDAFRVRVKRVTSYAVNDFKAPATTAILYLAFDAQPDVLPKSAGFVDSPRGLAGGTDVLFKPVLFGQRTGMSTSGARGIVTVDDITIPFDAEVKIDTACFLKDGPAELRRLDGLKVKARYRFSTSERVVKCPLAKTGELNLVEGLPVRVSFSSSYVQLMPSTANQRLEDLLDVNNLVVVGKEGREEKCTPMHATMSYYYFRCNTTGVTDPELRIPVYDGIFEREVEFSLKDVELRP